MAQRKRHQPWRACRGPPPVNYDPDVEEESEYAEGLERKSTLIAKRKPERIKSRVRATSHYEAVVVQQRPRSVEHLWRRLPPDLVDKVLGHLPVSRLWSTVMAISPTRWKRILSSGNLLGDGNHLDSSMGLIKICTKLICTVQTRGACAASNRDLCPLYLRAFEHITERWQSLPRFPESNRICLEQPSVQSVSEGLILMVDGPYKKMVIWNPVSQSHRLLPESPLSCKTPYFAGCFEVLVVDREKRGYKVIQFLESKVPGENQAHLQIPNPPGPAPPDHKVISNYTVYDSHSGTWGAIHVPPYIGRVKVKVIKKSMITCEGCVCFITMEKRVGLRPPSRESVPEGIVCYDPCLDRWSKVLFPPLFIDELPGNHIGQQLLYSSGKVYMIFLRMQGLKDYYYLIASTALANIQSGIPVFEHVGRLTEGLVSFDIQAAPESSPSRPEELILVTSCSQGKHQWYMLPVGRTWYLCVLVCGKWHKRFDLHARVWTNMVIEVPPDHKHGLAVVTSRSLETKKYHPYIPSWINP